MGVVALCTSPQYRAFGQKWEEWPIAPRCWAALQVDLNRSEWWAERNSLEFCRGRCTVLHLGRSTRPQGRLGWPLESSSAEQDLGCWSLPAGPFCPKGSPAPRWSWGLQPGTWPRANAGAQHIAESGPAVQCSTVIYRLLSVGICRTKYLSSKYFWCSLTLGVCHWKRVK